MRALGAVVVAILATAAFAVSVRAEQCGSQAGGALCPNCLCCSKWGFCGSTAGYCGDGCQSQCHGCGPTPPPPPPPHTPTPPTPAGGGVASIISPSMLDQMLLHRDDSRCRAQGFYTYAAFIAAANAFPGFGTTGSLETRKREVAAFLAQTSHETTGGWPDADDGPYSWGYCFKEERDPPIDYCDSTSTRWPCAPGKRYYGRGPMQLSWNFNYGQAGEALSLDLLGHPELVASDSLISFKTALWFWMTPQSPKPSCHDVMTGQWSPSAADLAAGRVPGYGLTTNIINGGRECGRGVESHVADRIGFYMRYCQMLGVSYGDNLDCYKQTPYAPGSTISAKTTAAATLYDDA